jgi:hypothetical protein
MSSSNFIASRIGKNIPEDYRKTGQRIACGECSAIFWIIGPRMSNERGVTDEQKDDMEITIAGEHFDEKFSEHLDFYEFD